MEFGLFSRMFLRVRTVNDRTFLLILVILLSGYWLLFHWPCLNYYWNNDDLHLIRKFTSNELSQVFTSTWDVDRIETPGFRPFTTWFNHFRYMFLGESPANHRLFLLILMSSLLWFVGWIGFKFGLNRGQIALALLILVSTKAFSGDIIWVADGIHVFQNLLIVIAIVAMMKFIKNKSVYFGLLSLFLVWMALWAREDSLVAFLIMPIIFVIYYCKCNNTNLSLGWLTLKSTKADIIKYSTYFILFFSIALLSLVLRKIYVPETSTSTMLPSSSLTGIINHIKMSMWIVGGSPSKEFLSLRPPNAQTGSLLINLLTYSWGMILGIYLLYYLITIRKFDTYARQISTCFICMGLACTPGFVVERSNLVFLPTLFFSFIVALTTFNMWDRASIISLNNHALSIKWSDKSYNIMHLSIILICIFAISGSMLRATIQRIDMHPLSINQISRNRIFLVDIKANIPDERVNYLIYQWDIIGIARKTTREELLNNVKMGLYNSDWSGVKPFIPQVTYLAP
ncbi:hypothetical protein [Geobacter sp. AOG2]|uniref:hypothetical protein n=1 Tax=Geobacter sp. AOG2 TaxID=1566347 RepID=UPI001CC44B7D|nr:hypothetical protein [Geobacter sp. AOG2]GFE62271.1 hypothetical protein AOG2_28590 [Geobacter sp. AOG2]